MKHRSAIWITFLILIIQASTVLSQVKSLDFFVQQGLSNSPSLKDLNNQIRTNTVDSLLIDSPRHPQISFNGLLSYPPVINGYGYSQAITNGGTFISTINLNQPLFDRKTTQAKYMKYGLANQAMTYTIRISENELKKNITSQYLTAYSISADISFSKALLKSLEEEENMLKQLTQNGIYRQSDYLAFKVELQARRILLNDLQIQYRKELSNLNYLCGLSDTNTCELGLPELAVNFPVKPETSGFFLRFHTDSLTIQNEKRLVDQAYKPDFSWSADAGLVNNEPKFIYKNFGVSVGVALSIPLLDGNQRKLNYQKLNISEETRRNYEQYFRVQYNEQLRQLNQELEMTRNLIPQIKQELDLAEAIISQDKDLISNGSISVTDYLLALRNYISIQQYKNQYEVKVRQIINEINYWRQ
jgi:outer membrane protein TolC